MKKVNKNKGFTLIEIIITIAILAIVIVPFLLLFTNTFQHIFAAGNKNQKLYDVQKKLENEIHHSYETGQAHSLVVEFPGVTQPVEIDGKIITIDEEYNRGSNKETVSLKIFIP